MNIADVFRPKRAKPAKHRRLVIHPADNWEAYLAPLKPTARDAPKRERAR